VDESRNDQPQQTGMDKTGIGTVGVLHDLHRNQLFADCLAEGAEQIKLKHQQREKEDGEQDAADDLERVVMIVSSDPQHNTARNTAEGEDESVDQHRQQATPSSGQ